MFLTDTDIAELTGLVRKSAQIRWLREHRYLHEIDAHGRPKVLLYHVQAKLGGIVDSPIQEPQLRL